MDHLLVDYKAYYNVRMQRYANDAMFGHSYKSEKNLYNCICSVTSIDELMQLKAAQFQELSVQNGIAFVQDVAYYKLHFYQQEKEDIQANGQRKIIDKINQAADVMQIVSTVNEIQIENDKAVLIDNMWPVWFFIEAIGWLEKIEVVKQADVPPNRKPYMQMQETTITTAFIKVADAFLMSIHQHEPGWKWNYELLLAYRHRKKCPLPDAVLQERISQCRILIR